MQLIVGYYSHLLTGMTDNRKRASYKSDRMDGKTKEQ